MAMDAAALAVWNALLASVAEEMGITLGLTAHSPNIRERRDYSCAIFDASGDMVAQAAHIPVHLGAMPEAVRSVRRLEPWSPGDVAIVNDPYLGGTHLPDISLIAPVFWERNVVGFVSNRAHHADVGGMAPGSMPVATELYQEGIIIPPLRLREAGSLNHDLLALLLRNVRTPKERQADLDAQFAALRTGERRFLGLFERGGPAPVLTAMTELQNYSERLTRSAIGAIPDGTFEASDVMESPGGELLPIRVVLRVTGDSVVCDFAGTAPQQASSLNAVAAVSRSAVAYCIRCLLPPEAPSNEGNFRPIHVELPEGSLVAALPQHAVSAGNVETSQRVTDVVLRALAEALPESIPAASAGSMSNFTWGGSLANGSPFAYYETIPGGAGGGPTRPGESGVQTHMTNTANTPVEALEGNHPVRIWRFELREGSGGLGLHRGGDGVTKEVEFLADASVNLVADRRRVGPWGLAGGGDGRPGVHALIKSDDEEGTITGNTQIDIKCGERIRIETPGGGGWGEYTD